MNSALNEETCRQVASSLVDNLVATAIVKASQELAFVTTPSQQQQAQQQHKEMQKSISRRNSENIKNSMILTNIDINGAVVEVGRTI